MHRVTQRARAMRGLLCELRDDARRRRHPPSHQRRLRDQRRGPEVPHGMQSPSPGFSMHLIRCRTTQPAFPRPSARARLTAPAQRFFIFVLLHLHLSGWLCTCV